MTLRTDGKPMPDDDTMPTRLVVGFPLAASMPSKFFSHWLTMDQSRLVGAVVVTGVYVAQNMDVLVDRFLSIENADRLVVMEHDMLPPLDVFNRIASYRPEHEIVGSMYFRRDPPFHANALMQRPDLKFDPISPDVVRQWCDEPQLYEVDGVGFGLTSIARHVLEGWDDQVEMFGTDRVFGSHDLWFCHHARRAGHRVFVDSGVVCEHLSELPVGLADNQLGSVGLGKSPAVPGPPRAQAGRLLVKRA